MVNRIHQVVLDADPGSSKKADFEEQKNQSINEVLTKCYVIFAWTVFNETKQQFSYVFRIQCCMKIYHHVTSCAERSLAFIMGCWYCKHTLSFNRKFLESENSIFLPKLQKSSFDIMYQGCQYCHFHQPNQHQLHRHQVNCPNEIGINQHQFRLLLVLRLRRNRHYFIFANMSCKFSWTQSTSASVLTMQRWFLNWGDGTTAAKWYQVSFLRHFSSIDRGKSLHSIETSGLPCSA